MINLFSLVRETHLSPLELEELPAQMIDDWKLILYCEGEKMARDRAAAKR